MFYFYTYHMKSSLLILLPFLTLAAAVPTTDAAPSKSSKNASLFTSDYAAAKEKAQASHKDILVSITGSDWCGYCIALDKEVFHTSQFKAKAPQYFELVQLDFPRDKSKISDEELKRSHATIKEILPSGYSYPDVALLDENGRVYAKTGYREGGVRPYLKHLEELRARRIQRDKAFAMAEKVKGVDRAKHLDAAITALRSSAIALSYYGETIKEIISLDADDKAGLKSKYTEAQQTSQIKREIDSLMGVQNETERTAKLKAFAEREDVTAEARQYALYMTAAIRSSISRADKISLLNKAIKLAPKSTQVDEEIKPLLEHLKKSR